MSVEKGCASCAHCGGVWYSFEEARVYFALDLDEGAPPSGVRSFVLSGDKICPSCLRGLVKVSVEAELQLDQCERCSGLFFDEGESLALRSKLASGFEGPLLRKKLAVAIQQVQRGPYR